MTHLKPPSDANALWHNWMKRFGNGCGNFQSEMVHDINTLMGNRICEINKFWMKEVERLTNKVYRLERELKK